MSTLVETARSRNVDPFADPNADSPPVPPKKSSRDKPDIVEEVRDTVHVRGSANRMGRSQTNGPAPSSRTTPQVAPRSVSHDSAPTEKKKSSKKGSKHADVIDRLDYSGVGPMFHHDGPFDACAPSRNRQKNRAPMMAWSGRPEDMPKEYADDGPYPTSPPALTDYEPSRKKVDAIAEAWGIHEPEPYEEFFAGGGGGTTGNTPASSIYNGKESSRKTPDRPRAHARRSQLPPPMPIFVPDSLSDDNSALPDSPGSPGNNGNVPKRNKSIMQRIRKMRDAPNVPVNDEEPPAETSGERPTHRSQGSFLGRVKGRGGNPVSPTSETSEAYVFIEPRPGAKDLPVTPGSAPATSPGEHGSPNGYFDEGESPPSNGLGRKTSLMKKVGRVVRGTR
ncbi:hypothetical protein MIND_00479100 [Mycena indigotica]|uniref:Pal1-domain-containing protein n=1 Tax=Mycena indigotica TaxID=2126181 RepID=A0A8H6W5T5_9AGAR|nr:uncharacterized protein MIND_00479100 [Mycena indigotica]KAF7306869.1 hypothetical protein MIND_00479100 [Mycena indigotica]